jgi:aminoglycoside phosphotransferase (APT) family kinase protein
VYLRDRFNEPGMKVTSFQPLAGGFGKQTILFDVEGKALSGGFVMRRDMGNVPTVANDCHMIKQEYPVIKAAAARGFSAPDALWLDTEHKLLPGWDFIVMRRAPGKVPGNFFGAQSQVPPGLTDELADIMSRLHRLAPMTELGDLTESIRSESWKLTKAESTARYIRNWYDLWVNAEHWPSPALMAIFGWLFDNAPDRQGPPSMLHGDVGFHNFLFDEGKLSAVVDWEFAHVGDPAEEIGMVKVTTGASINWEQLMSRYLAGGGEPIDEKTLHYFQVWGYARNAAASNIASAKFIKGDYNELKLAFLPVGHFPHFIQFAQALIDKAP